MARSWGGTLARKIDGQSNLDAFRPQSNVVTLVAGIGAVTGVVMTGNSYVSVRLRTAGGTLGVQYLLANLTATSFDIRAIDTAGAVEANDTSTVHWAILG
jgi:hypothetical protein